MTSPSDPTRYRVAKIALLRAALAYAGNPTEGQAYALRVQARAFAKTREECGPIIPIDLEIQE